MATSNAINNALPNVAAHAVLIGEGSSAVVGVPLNTGQILVGVTGADPVAQTLQAISTWVDVTGTTQAAAINTGYIADNASLVTITLPTTAAVGSVIKVAGKGAGGWLLAQNASQLVHFGNQVTTTGTGGSLASTSQYDAIEILCVTANTTFIVLASQGNITVV